MWPIILSDRLLIVALVGHYPANKLIRRKLILGRPKALILRYHLELAPVSRRYARPKGR